LAGFQAHTAELDAAGAKVVAASVDSLDDARKVAAEVSNPIAYGVTRDMADKIGAWWEERRGFIQPSEFIVGADDKVVMSSYSSGPLARLDAADAVKLIKLYESRK
jgi:peroxiredoxin